MEEQSHSTFWDRIVAILGKESLLLALIPAAGYLLTFSFERGVCSYYGIPDEIITLSIQRVVLFSTTISVSLYLALMFTYAILSFVVNGEPVGAWTKANLPNYGVATLSFCTLAIVFFSIGSYRMGSLFLLFGLASVGWTTLVERLRRRHPEPEAQIANHDTTPSRWQRFSDDNLIALPRPVFVAWLCMVMAILVNFVVYSAGEAFASLKHDYPVIKIDGEEYIIARIYDGVIYCCPYFADDHQFGRDVRAMESKSAKWRVVHTGSLERKTRSKDDGTSKPSSP